MSDHRNGTYRTTATPATDDRFDDAAVLCGVCRTELSVASYLDRADTCPACGAAFNPGCRNHHHLYFE